ncbi:MAG: hypothetical protein ACTHJ0_12460 [Flavipsychrobacter sp.]
MKKALRFIACLLIVSLAVISCKKDTNKKDTLVGQWQQEGYPNNNLTFNADGTGKQIDGSGIYIFNWSLADNDNSIVLYDGSTYLDTWKIRELNSGRFTFQDVTGGYIYTFIR